MYKPSRNQTWFAITNVGAGASPDEAKSWTIEAANSDKGELQKLLEERDREIALLRTELTSKHSQLVEQKKKLDSALIRASDVSSIEVSLFFLHAIGRLLIIACTWFFA